MENFKSLENCTVIEGFLRISLIDYAEFSDYSQLHYPNLVEVTDHIVLYRVYGLRSLSHIFPNLAVIRGNVLFFNYALVSFEMPDLQELGFYGLTKILNGAVRLEKNPQLCYLDTIDWSLITSEAHHENDIIFQNKDVDECVNVCPETGCDARDGQHYRGEQERQQWCWTADHCQKGKRIIHCRKLLIRVDMLATTCKISFLKVETD